MESNTPTLDQEFRIISDLGEGTFGQVFLGERINDGLCFAIKKYRHHEQHEYIQAINNEFNIMESLNHPNIAKTYQLRQKAIYQDTDGQKEQRFVAIMQYIEGSNIRQLISYDKSRVGFVPEISRTLFKALLDALQYVHEKQISHRDVNIQNIMIDRNSNLKLIDFGWAIHFRKGKKIRRGPAGTKQFNAPEMRKGDYDGIQVDLFAAGIALFFLHSGDFPFINAMDSDDFYKLLAWKKYEQFWKKHPSCPPSGFYSQQFKDLMNHMLSKDPKDRYTMEQIRSHPWTKGECMPLSSIQEEINKRLEIIQIIKKKKEQEKVLDQKKKYNTQFNPFERSSCPQLADYFQLLQQITIDQSLIPIAQRTTAKDLILDKSARWFTAELQQFFSKQKEDNLIVNSNEQERFKVRIDEEKFEIKVEMRFTFFGQQHYCEVVILLRKTKDGKLVVRIARKVEGDFEQNQSPGISFIKYRLSRIIRDEFECFHIK